MNILYALLLSSIAGLSTLIGALFIFLKIKPENINKAISLALSFSLIIMIGISLFDLFPEGIKLINKSYGLNTLLLIFPMFLISFILVKTLNKLLAKYENNLFKLGILSMITLILHNFPEGILTFLSSVVSPSLGLKLTLAIAIHNIPEGLAISFPIYYSTGSKKKAILYSLASGLAEPLGALLAYFFLAKFITPGMIGLILIIVSGLMITLAIESMLPEATKRGNHKEVCLGFFIGGIVLLLNFII